MKKLSKKALASVAMLCALSTVSVSAASNSNIYINNVPIVTTVTPYVRNGYTLVPLRTISENLGCEVAYDANAKKITLSKNNTQTELWIGQYNATTNGNTQTLDVAPEIKDGSTMVPLRFLSNVFGCGIDYNADTKEVFITATSINKEKTDKLYQQYKDEIEASYLYKWYQEDPVAYEHGRWDYLLSFYAAGDLETLSHLTWLDELAQYCRQSNRAKEIMAFYESEEEWKASDRHQVVMEGNRVGGIDWDNGLAFDGPIESEWD